MSIFPFASNYNLARSPAKGNPVISAIDGFDAEACGQEEQLEFAWEEDVHVEFGQVTFVLHIL